MRSLWKGSITFGLVTIPVKLYAATEKKDVRFNYLHVPCRTPIRYVKMYPTCNREVPMEEIAMGYEFEKGQYVVLRDEDFESVPAGTKKTVDIVDFVRLEEIDPIYYDKSYFLEPGEGGAKAYHLLRQAMERTGRVALARVVIRTKESLAAIRVYKEGVLCLETMFYPDEIRSAAGLAVNVAAPPIRPEEMEMAIGLVSSLSGSFDPAKFRNEHREALLQAIHQRIAGREVVAPEAPAPAGRVVDLLEALRSSIRVAEETRGAGAAAVGGGGRVGPAAAPPGVAAGEGPPPPFPVRPVH